MLDVKNFYLSRYGNSLIMRYKGQNENPEDRKTGMPSVFRVKEILFSFFRNPPENNF